MKTRLDHHGAFGAIGLLLLLPIVTGAADIVARPSGRPPVPGERMVAGHVDQLLLRRPKHAPPSADDETFLRRVSLDLAGKLPTPEEIRAFLADRSLDKRTRQIDRLLASEAYAVNWARYWRDTLTYHTPAS